jgi:hypothetical protein
MHLSNTLNKFHLTSTAIFLLSCLLTGGCVDSHLAECKRFVELPLEQQQAKFKTYALEKQLELYHCAMKQRPPVMGYEYEISGHGEKIIPILVEKLRVEKEDDSKLELIRILQVMFRRGDVRDPQSIIEEVGRAVSSIRLYQMKLRGQEMVEDMKKKRGG